MFNLDSSLGVEVRGNRLILASVRKGFQEYSLRSHLIVEDFAGLPRNELVARIRQFARTNGFNRENVVVGLSRASVVIREVEFPLDVEENLAQVVKSQVERFEPVEESRSVYDYAVVYRDEESRRLRIQITMAPLDAVESVLNLSQEVGLYPASIRHSGTGLGHLLMVHEDGRPRREPVLIVRVEREFLELVCVGPDQAIQSQAAAWNGDPADADRLLEAVAELLAPWEDRLQTVGKLYLTGTLARAAHPAIKQRVPDSELLESGLALRWKGVARPPLEELAGAIGLAISGISRLGKPVNLIPAERRLVGGRPSLVATYLLAGVFVVGVGAEVTRGYFQQRALADQVQGQIAALQPEVEVAFQLREQAAAKRAELEEISKLFGRREKILLVLKDLTERLPDDSYLQNVQIEGQQVTIQGFSSQASSLLPLLSESLYLEGVKANWITQDARQGKERFNFTARVK